MNRGAQVKDVLISTCDRQRMPEYTKVKNREMLKLKIKKSKESKKN